MTQIVSLADIRKNREAAAAAPASVVPAPLASAPVENQASAPKAAPADAMVIKGGDDKEMFNYQGIIAGAMLGAVRSVLTEASENGLPEKSNLYITFDTAHPGVEISDWMKTKYAEGMTINLDRWWKDLSVEEDRFSVILNFSDVEESLTIPFKAIMGFNDAAAQFGLGFRANA